MSPKLIDIRSILRGTGKANVCARPKRPHLQTHLQPFRRQECQSELIIALMCATAKCFAAVGDDGDEVLPSALIHIPCRLGWNKRDGNSP